MRDSVYKYNYTNNNSPTIVNSYFKLFAKLLKGMGYVGKLYGLQMYNVQY